MEKKILITGVTGFVGNKIFNSIGNSVAAPSLRNATQETIKRIIEESEAEIIVHTAAISDIGDCEADPKASHFANVQIPIYLANASKGRKLICFSSDQVYSGCDDDGPYTEDNTKPANTYAKHKLEMENRVLDIDPNTVMLRAEWMYDFESYKDNYFLNVLNAKGSISNSSMQYRGVTYLQEVANNMEKVFELTGGAYNFGSETTKSIYEITKNFIDYINKDIELIDIQPRHNLWMDCSKAKKQDVIFSSVEDGLIKCYNDYKSQG